MELELLAEEEREEAAVGVQEARRKAVLRRAKAVRVLFFIVHHVNKNRPSFLGQNKTPLKLKRAKTA
jgi:hypothetical protein